jgi:PAS domain S-box-containing protein
LFELNPTPMWVFDSETMRFLDINPAAIAHYGYSREEFLAMTVNDIRLAEDVSLLKSRVEQKTSEFADSGIWRHRKKDWTMIEVEIVCGRLKYAGRPAVMTIATDVTTRRRAEGALRASEERYRALFEQAVEGIYQSSPDGRFLRANPAAARLLGYASAEDLVARGLAPKLYTQPDRYQEIFSRLERDGRLNEFESEINCGDGHTRWISENARVIRDAGGGISYIESFISDISERKRLEQEMLRTSKLESVGLLAGGIAHDFNNILTVIMGNIALAALVSDAHDSVLQLLQAAERATLRARDLTQQLLTFAKGGDPVRTAVNLAELIQESAQFARHGSNVRCDFDLLPDLWPVNADKGQLAQVMQNLVINAVQAMPNGGVIRISARNVSVPPHSSRPLAAGDFVRIDIADSGVGITPENLAKIFDPYFTTKRQGSGLGLATAYSIVHKHQGLIEVESEQGRGTIFHIWMPALPAAPLGPVVPETQLLEMTGRVLFMDDDEPIREMAKVMLSRLGFEVMIVNDGAAAVDAYREARDAGRPFDVVVMDLTVPGGMGGREALEHLRSLDPRVRAIVSSGYSSDPVMANYRNYGFRGMVGKPYKTGDFAKVLREVIEEVK